MTACEQTIRRTQKSGELLPYGFNWTRELARRWQSDHPFAAGVAIRPSTAQTGLQYRSSGGQSAEEEPDWSLLAAGDTAQDGSILWTAEEISNDSLADRIDSDGWTATPTGLTIQPGTAVISAGLQQTSAMLGSTTAGVYTVKNEMLSNLAREYIGVIILTIN